jgi:SHAQKYF class myb-like DNA-binding protein
LNQKGTNGVENDPDKTITESSNEGPQGVTNSMNMLSQSESSPDKFENIKEGDSIKDEQNEYSQGRWTLEEHFRFIEGILIYGNNWKKVQKHIGTRSPIQARSHAQKFFIRIKKAVFDDRTPNKSICVEHIVNRLKSFIKHEILSRIIMNNESKNYISILENKDKLCKVLLLMISNISKGKISKLKLQSLDKDITDLDVLFKTEDISLMEKALSNFVKKKTKKEIQKVVPTKIFNITKTQRKSSLGDQLSLGVTNDNSLHNITHNQLQNNYINIVTINVCDKDNVPYSMTNPLDINFLANKSIMNVKKKDDTFNPYSIYNNICDDFIKNDMNLQLNEADEIINSFFVNKKDDDKDFDMDNFFTK